MGRMKKLSGIQVGISGEYFVAAELSRRGYVASLTLRNTRGIDVLASNADATKSVGIQVKTCQGDKPVWLLNVKTEADQAETCFTFSYVAGEWRAILLRGSARCRRKASSGEPSKVARHSGAWRPPASRQLESYIQGHKWRLQGSMGCVGIGLKVEIATS